MPHVGSTLGGGVKGARGGEGTDRAMGNTTRGLRVDNLCLRGFNVPVSGSWERLLWPAAPQTEHVTRLRDFKVFWRRSILGKKDGGVVEDVPTAPRRSNDESDDKANEATKAAWRL